MKEEKPTIEACRLDLNTCMNLLKEFYIQQIQDEWDDPERGIKTTREEAEAAIDYDLDVIKDRVKEFKWTFCQKDSLVKEGLEELKKVAPDLETRIAPICWIFDNRYDIGDSALHVPFFIKDQGKQAIILAGAHTKYLSPKAIARVLAHEALHVVMRENPEEFGLEKEMLFTHMLFGLDEERIEKKVDELGLGEYREETTIAWNKVFRDRRNKKIKRLYTSDPHLRLKVCMDGGTFKPAREKILEELKEEEEKETK